MPKITTIKVKKGSRYEEAQVYYNRKQLFHIKGIDLSHLKRFGFSNENPTEAGLLSSLSKATTLYEDEMSSVEKVIIIDVYTGKSVEWISTSETSRVKRRGASSRSLDADSGFAFDYDVCFKKTKSGEVSIYTCDSDGKMGYKIRSNHYSAPGSDGVIEIPYTEDAVAFLSELNTMINNIATKFRDFMNREDLNDIAIKGINGRDLLALTSNTSSK